MTVMNIKLTAIRQREEDENETMKRPYPRYEVLPWGDPYITSLVKKLAARRILDDESCDASAASSGFDSNRFGGALRSGMS